LNGNDNGINVEDRRGSSVDKEEPVPKEDDLDEWFDAEEEEFHDCKEDPDLFWFDCFEPERKEKWFNCKQIPLPKPPNKSKEKVHVGSVLPAYPCALMMLSFVMLTMHTVGMMLRMIGFD
jgi:hypothetical protein